MYHSSSAHMDHRRREETSLKIHVFVIEHQFYLSRGNFGLRSATQRNAAEEGMRRELPEARGSGVVE